MATPITGERGKLYYNGTAIGCVQNCKFSGNTELKDIACAAASGYKDYAVGLIGWDVGGQFVPTEEGTEADTILGLWKARQKITGKFEITGTGGYSISGDVIISSIGSSANVQGADPVSFDITMTGCGEPTV